MKETFLGKRHISVEDDKDDPFTRKRGITKLVSGGGHKNKKIPDETGEKEEEDVPDYASAVPTAPSTLIPPPPSMRYTGGAVVPKKAKAEDLFSAHDFDIQINLDVPVPNGKIPLPEV